jgi:hypothetical protein
MKQSPYPTTHLGDDSGRTKPAIPQSRVYTRELGVNVNKTKRRAVLVNVHIAGLQDPPLGLISTNLIKISFRGIIVLLHACSKCMESVRPSMV